MGRGRDFRAASDAVAAALAPSGLDLVHPFRVGWWDDGAPPGERLPGARRSGSLGVLVGNTRALWPVFLEAVRREPARRDAVDPLDGWIEEVFARALAAVPSIADVVFAHEPPPRRLPMQRLASSVGLAPLSPGQLLAHRELGPWFALRAVVLVDAPGPEGAAPRGTEPCGSCDAPCRAAFEHARAVTDALEDHARLPKEWRPWLAVRDACPVGRAHRYSLRQIEFHYARRWPDE